MFAYCNNDPVNCVDSEGTRVCLNNKLMSNDGGGSCADDSVDESINNMGEFVENCTAKLKAFRRNTKTFIRAIGSSIEADVGVGVGAHIETSVYGFNISAGNSGNYFVFAVDDCKLSTYSTYSESLYVGTAVVSAGYKCDVIRDFKWNVISEENPSFLSLNDSIPIFSGKAYLFAGASWNISFNYVEFINTLSEEFGL